ncbi:MAG: peroxide stress protein YaaA [Acidimicrobiia bacterium]|nr:peroxide stress protein YaaA [Acidimicrobiia bacterium]
MLILLSPAKSLDFTSPLPTRKRSQPRLVEDAERLVEVMRHKRPDELAKLMGISDELAQLNWERFQEWEPAFTRQHARPALLAFNGDVYRGLQARERFGERDYTFAQKHLRILSGLHGVLRPLDLIHPYRLEMGASVATERGKNVYEFWGDRITGILNDDLGHVNPKVVVNLASKEYFTAVDPGAIDGTVISPVFKDLSRGEYRTVSFYAKAARGEMAAWLILNRIKTQKGILQFAERGYRHAPGLSTRAEPVFIRDEV